MSCTVDRRKPCHSHKPRPAYRLSGRQADAMFYVRNAAVKVRVLMPPCGPDESVSASVMHSGVPYWVRRQQLPTWRTYKALYKAGVVRLVCPNPDYPYDYVVEPHPDHPLNK